DSSISKSICWDFLVAAACMLNAGVWVCRCECLNHQCLPFTAASCSIKVIGQVGQNITLPCRYDTQTNGGLTFCWGRGAVPWSKCSNTILSFKNGDVIFRTSLKYQLLGRVAEGELSLTIMDAQRADAGVYGCRVEVPGLYNDQKVNTQLVMEAPPEKPSETTKGNQPSFDQYTSKLFDIFGLEKKGTRYSHDVHFYLRPTYCCFMVWLNLRSAATLTGITNAAVTGLVRTRLIPEANILI
uniref:Ig-like domain-containing protein n=1 Tax=Nothobranchius furzeri TaxID=105023 RepID=A0A8C6LZE2_NOTFU